MGCHFLLQLGEGAKGHILALNTHNSVMQSDPEALDLSLSPCWAHSQADLTFYIPG